jgi:phosphosulfolactate synthase (CoM biosynthesis protein A)
MSKLILGFKKIERNQEFIIFSKSEKCQIIEDYLSSGESKQSIWKKYTGRSTYHGELAKWMCDLGYILDFKKKNVSFVAKKAPMIKPDTGQEHQLEFEILQLKSRTLELEKRLRESELKSLAYQTMIELAEREFNISIKKKFNTKPFGK